VVLGARKGIFQGRLRGGPRALIDKYSPHDVVRGELFYRRACTIGGGLRLCHHGLLPIVILGL